MDDVDHRLTGVIKRALLVKDRKTCTHMKRVSAAAAILIAGKPGRDMVSPEPLVQVGFEPDEHEMEALVARAKLWDRDLIHVSCHADGVAGPTGMIAAVYFEDGQRVHIGGAACCVHPEARRSNCSEFQISRTSRAISSCGPARRWCGSRDIRWTTSLPE